MKLSEKAYEFYLTATYASQHGFWAHFVDNLFTATEILAKAILLTSPDIELRNKTNHKTIHYKFNNFINIGNGDIIFKDSLNKLAAFRDELRYMNNNNANFSAESADYYLAHVRTMIDYSTSRIDLTLEIHRR